MNIKKLELYYSDEFNKYMNICVGISSSYYSNGSQRKRLISIWQVQNDVPKIVTRLNKRFGEVL